MNVAEIKIVKWREGVTLKHLDRESIFNAMQEIDRSVFYEKGQVTEQSGIERYEAYKNSYTLALYEDKIVGYLCCFPITEEFYNIVIKGLKVYDGNIEGKDICHLNDTSNYMFILSVAILPEYQKKGISKLFIGMLAEEFSKIKISDIASYAFTDGGEHFLNALGLRKVKNMEGGTKLMRRFFKDDN